MPGMTLENDPEYSAALTEVREAQQALDALAIAAQISPEGENPILTDDELAATTRVGKAWAAYVEIARARAKG